MRERHPKLLLDTKRKQHFHHSMLHGFDFDNTMARIGSMNMLLHGSGESRHHLSRLARAEQLRRRREVHAGAGESAFAAQPSITRQRQGSTTDRQDEKDRAAVPRAVLNCSSPQAVRQSSRRTVVFIERAPLTRRCERRSSRTEAGCCPRTSRWRVQSPTRAYPPQFVCSLRPIRRYRLRLVLRRLRGRTEPR